MIEGIIQPKQGTYAACERSEYPKMNSMWNSDASANILTVELLDRVQINQRHHWEQKLAKNFPRDFDLYPSEDC